MAMYVCPACGKEIVNYLSSCRFCGTTVFEKVNDVLTLMNPEEMDKSVKYKVHGMVDGHFGNGYSEFYPGEVVEIKEDDNQIWMSDVSYSYVIDGGNKGRKFIMPQRDIYIVTVRRGMMINDISFTGPYGERLKGDTYCPENILKDNEFFIPEGNNISFMGMSLLEQGKPAFGLADINAAVPNPQINTPKEDPYPWEGKPKFCPECGTPTAGAKNFCPGCGAFLKEHK